MQSSEKLNRYFQPTEFPICRRMGFITTNPHYPQSNGLAEKGIKIAKLFLKKSVDEDFDRGLLKKQILEDHFRSL